MSTRLVRVVAKAAAAAGTAGTIVATCWLLDRMLTQDSRKCVEKSRDDNSSVDRHQELNCEDETFALLPVVSESDDDSEVECALGYTDDCYTPQHDVCVLSVSVQTHADSNSNDCPVDTRSCRVCKAAGDCHDDPRDRPRSLSFAETDSSSGESEQSNPSGLTEEKTASYMESPCSKNCEPRRTENWLYVRL